MCDFKGRFIEPGLSYKTLMRGARCALDPKQSYSLRTCLGGSLFDKWT